MLEKKDLEAIRGIVQETVGEVLEEIVLPRFAQIDARFDQMDRRFDRIESTMVTKDYLEDRLVDFKATLKQTGGQALRQIKSMATELHRNNVLSAEQVVQITTA